MSDAPRRIVLDTNVCLALLLYADPACAGLRGLLASHQAVANAATRGEWLRVLREGRFPFDDTRRAAAGIAYDQCTLLLEPAPRALALPRCRDADDQKFLELARDAGAVLLCTRDRELLRLARRTRRDAGFDVLPPESVETGASAVAM
jgi:predicted nucleic acid-binding protein